MIGRVLVDLQPALAKRLKAEFVFELSLYYSGGPGTTLSRENAHLSGSRALSWLRDLNDTIGPDGEVALHSRVLLEGRKGCFHIPMIDVQGRGLGALAHRVRDESARLDAKASIFESGRGFHVYFHTVLRPSAWHEYLGRILLWSPPEPNDLAVPVDVRWVGHSIEKHYSALRLTRLTPDYRSIPRWVCDILPVPDRTAHRNRPG